MRTLEKAVLISLGMTAILLPSAAIAEPTARINQVTGKVELKRVGWKDFQNVSSGTEFQLGDLIRPDINAKVSVICPDLSEQSVPVGVPSGLKGVCPNVPRSNGRGDKLATGTIGGTNPNIPYIISPRHTLLLSRTPILRWNPVVGAKRYVVKILSPTGVVWQTETAKSEIQYPGQPILQPGVPYSLVVQSDNSGVSTADTGSNIEFRILRDAEHRIIESQLSNLLSAKRLPTAVALSLSDYYSDYTLPPAAEPAYRLSEAEAATYGLVAEGIEILSPLIQAKTSSPLVYRMLGDLYWQTGLVLPAIEQYHKAIAFSKKPEELENSTEAQLRLGEIYAATGDRSLAIKWYERAKEGYLLLGDVEKVKFLARQIQILHST